MRLSIGTKSTELIFNMELNMINETMKKLKDTIKSNKQLSDEKREKLLSLSEELHSELNKLDDKTKKAAHVVAEKAHEAANKISDEKIATPHELIQEFEASHPNLTRILQQLFAQFGV